MANTHVSASAAAKLLGCSRSSICRAAKKNKLGVFAGDRLAALSTEDVEKIRPLLHATAGNPNWIAAKATKSGK